MADQYIHGHPEPVLRSHRWRTAENSAAYLLPHLASTDDLLDVGCGPGTITLDLARRVGRAVGVDAAADVVDEAATVASREAPERRPEFRVADLYNLPFDDDSFDVVHAHQVLQHLTDPVAALREMARVARPGAVLAVRDSDYGAFTWSPAHDGLLEWQRRYRSVARSLGAEPDAGRHLIRWCREAGLSRPGDVVGSDGVGGSGRVHGPDGVDGSYGQVESGDVTASASAWCFTGQDRAWWASVWIDRIGSDPLRSRLLADGADESDMAAMVDGWRSWSDSIDGWFVVLHGEVLVRL